MLQLVLLPAFNHPKPSARFLLLVFTVAALDLQTPTNAEVKGSTAGEKWAEKKYFVAPNGADTADGSQAHPFKTISRAAKAAGPNTTILVAPGTYEGGFKTTASGTAEARIRFISSMKWGAKLIPPAESKNDTAWDNRGSFVDIDGFEVDGSASQRGTKWTYGIYFGGSYGLIRNNHVHHIATDVPCTSAGGSAIGVDSYYHGVHDDVVGNVVHDVGPPGCRFVQGIYVSTSGTVKNNVVYRISEAAIHLWHDASNVVISHNTVATSHTGIIVGGGDFYHTSGPNDYTEVFNNIVYDCTSGISEQGRTGIHNSYHHNLVSGNTSNWSLKNGVKATDSVDSPPLFTSYTRTGTPDFRPRPNSPAIARGYPTGALEFDLDGRERNKTAGFDIGAFQHWPVRQ